MKPITFKGYNSLVAEKQDQYNTLPALIIGQKGQLSHCITCWELSEDEMMDLARTKKVYIATLYNIGIPPMNVSVASEDLFNLPESFKQDPKFPINT